jgi:hypothetical protein
MRYAWFAVVSLYTTPQELPFFTQLKSALRVSVNSDHKLIRLRLLSVVDEDEVLIYIEHCRGQALARRLNIALAQMLLLFMDCGTEP